MPSRIRVIEYEILFWDELEEMEEISEIVTRKMGRVDEVGILRCTVLPRTKVTLVAGADATLPSSPAAKPVSHAECLSPKRTSR
jgi:hypothetical protein